MRTSPSKTPEARRAYRLKNRERLVAYAKRYRLANREHIAALARARYTSDPKYRLQKNAINARARARDKAAGRLTRTQLWYRANREYMAEYHRAYKLRLRAKKEQS